MSYAFWIGVGEAGRSDGHWAALGGFFLSFSFGFPLFLRRRVLLRLARLTEFCLNQHSSVRVFRLTFGQQCAAVRKGFEFCGLGGARYLPPEAPHLKGAGGMGGASRHGPRGIPE